MAADIRNAPKRGLVSSHPRKTCFVTIGATTGFQDLINAVMAADFISILEAQSYTHLIVQHGVDGAKHFAALNSALSKPGISIAGFGVDPAGLDDYMLLAKGAGGTADVEGVVISHAGSGTVLNAMRLALPLIVVPNEKLLDNHQVELAEVLAKQGYVVRGHVHKLAAAIVEAETLRKRLHGWPPVNSGAAPVGGGGIQAVMDEEMGFLD